ncbi:hypothetical protein R1sor_020368 [Riccia sorocarpa]|uniref:Uncharacterized protein n=1 Tax=Riccia sorocarpa TaxID=122646 RepID=A0ABD3IGB8_9MARC
MARSRGGGVVRRRPGRPRGAGSGAAAAAGRGRADPTAAPAAGGRGRRRAAPVAAPARNVRARRGVPDPPESSGSERGDSADETEAEVDEAELDVEEAEPEPEDIEGGRRPRRRNRRDQEGASLIPFHFTPDAELSVKWGWVLTEEIQPIVDVISDEDIVKLNFVGLLGHEYQQPHFAACLEFIRSYDSDTHSGTVGGTVVTLSRQLVRDAFGLRYGMKPMDMKIKHTKIEDWFPVRDEKRKRYFARDCSRGMGWAAFLQLVGMVSLPRRRIKCIPAHLIFYVRSKIEGPFEDNYDLTAFTLEMLRHEIVQVRLHLDRTRHQRYLITFLGVLLTTILAHARVIDLAETITQPQPVPTRETVQEAVIRQRVIQDLGASSSQTAEQLHQQVTELEARRANLEETIARMSSVEDPRPRLVPPESTRVRRDFTLIFWTSRLKRNVDVLLRDLDERSLIPGRFFLTEPEVEVWAQEECTRYETPRESDHGGVLYLKRFARLYNYNLASQDVLLVDDFVKKNSTNSPFSAIHPRSFTPWREDHAPHRDQYLCGTLLPWLQAWRQSPIPTPTYVRAHYAELGAQDPFEALRSYWGLMVHSEHSSLLFCDATADDRELARSIFIGEVTAAEVPVAAAGVDDVPVAAAGVDDVPVAAAGVDVIPVAIPIGDVV